MLVESLCQVLNSSLDLEKLYRRDVGVAYDSALLYDPSNVFRSHEPSNTTEPVPMLDEYGPVDLIDKMRDVPVGEGLSSGKSIG